MNEETKWRVVIHQRYTYCHPGEMEARIHSTAIADLTIKAISAQEAMDKGDEWIKTMGIADAFVDEVNCEDVQMLDLTGSYQRIIPRSE